MLYESITVGSEYSFEKVISEEDVLVFAKLTGDHNPLHVNREFGVKSEFKQNICHGMLAASLFSTLVGMYCPGENSLYLSQSANFKSPIFYNKKVLVKGTVVEKYDSVQVIKMRMQILSDNKVLVDGEAKVKVVNYEK